MQCELSDTELGVLVLGCDPFVVMSISVGSPEVREVVRNRSLADGTIDDTRFMGSRAITLAIRFNDLTACAAVIADSMQTLIDRITPYMHPHRRPKLTWQLPRSTELRSATVRGVNWGWTVASPKANSITPQWVVPSGEIMGAGADARQCITMRPSSDVESGRTYDLVFPRVYPPSPPLGGRFLVNPGTTDSQWTLTVFGPAINPIFTVNGIRFAADRRGGVVVAAGQTLVVNTRNRTVLLNGVADASRYQYTNYDEWAWDDLLLAPGINTVRFEGTGLTVQSSAELCYVPTYL